MAGFHGKIPSKGDFVSRGLSREVVAMLDDWFQTGMVESKNALDSTWLAHYQVAPIWHYYLSPGVIDDNAWLGIWIPSIDKVARNFPLNLLAPTEQLLSKIVQVHQYDDWFVTSEELLLDALEPDLDFDWFCQAAEQNQPVKNVFNADLIDRAFPGEAQMVPKVADTPAPLELSPLELRLQTLENALQKIADHLQIDVGLGDVLAQELEAIKADSPSLPLIPLKIYSEFEYGINLVHSPDVIESRTFGAEHEPFCLWLSDGNDAIAQQLVVSKGLPDKTDFSRFLTGFE